MHNLISVWNTNQAAFSGSDPAKVRLWRWKSNKRIWSHLIYTKYTGDDEQVKALVVIIRLHANIAERYMNDEISYSAYADVAGYAESSGRYFAEKIEKKYDKGNNVITAEDKPLS